MRERRKKKNPGSRPWPHGVDRRSAEQGGGPAEHENGAGNRGGRRAIRLNLLLTLSQIREENRWVGRGEGTQIKAVVSLFFGHPVLGKEKTTTSDQTNPQEKGEKREKR